MGKSWEKVGKSWQNHWTIWENDLNMEIYSLENQRQPWIF